MQGKNQFLLWLIIVVIALGIILKMCYPNSHVNQGIPKANIIRLYDTIYQVQKAKVDTIYKTKVKIIARYKVDTVYVPKDSLPQIFTAKDTLITQNDTVDISFYYPEIYFKYVIKPRPDTVLRIKETIFVTSRDTINLQWWQRIEAGIIGFSLGILIAILR